MAASGTVDSPATADRAQPGALPALLLLIAINLFNYVDRQVLAAVEPEIRRELLPADQVSAAEAGFLMGLLSTAFLVMYMVSAPLFGWLSERMSRWWIVGIGVLIWSLASGASGINWHANLALAFWLLLATRLFVGVGEGAYGPVAPTMLSDLYPVSKRGLIIALFYLALPIGGALGYAFGEVVKSNLGWRWAFYLVLPPGLLLGAWCFFMREPRRGGADGVDAENKHVGWRDYLGLFAIPSFTLCTIGMTAMTFALGGIAFWMAAFLEGRIEEAAAVPSAGAITTLAALGGDPLIGAPNIAAALASQNELARAAQRARMDPLGIGERTMFGAITALAGLLATLAGGIVGDWLRGKVTGAYFVVSGIAMTLGFPMLLLFLWTPFPAAWIFGFLTVFCLFFNTGPCNAILANVVHPSLRAAGFAVNILVIHALGDAISPPIIGFIRGTWSIDTAFIVVSVFMVVGGIVWLAGARFLDRDTTLAPTRL